MTSTQFKNDNVAVTVNRKPGSKVVLDIVIQPKAAETAYREAIKTINKQVSLPGFRKGKAPEAMIIKQYAPHIEREWREIAVSNAYQDAIRLAATYPYHESGMSRPQLKKLSREEGGELIIEFEAFPEIPEIHVDELDLQPLEVKEISEEQIDDAVEDIKYQHAEWTDITDRPSEEGDYLEITIENIEGKEPLPLFNHTRFKVDEENMGNWMRKLVIGKNSGDQVEGVSEKETKKGVEENANFKPTKLRITIHKIQTAALPEVNDEFAKKLGLESVDAIREKVKGELQRFAEEDGKEEMRNQLSELLVRKYHIDLPVSMVQEDMKRQSEIAIARVRATAKEGEDIAAQAKQAAAEAAKEVENSYKLYFLLRKVAESHKIVPSAQEVMHELMRQMFAINPHNRIIDPKGDPQESRSRIHAYLVEQKTKDWLIEQSLMKKEKA